MDVFSKHGKTAGELGVDKPTGRGGGFGNRQKFRILQYRGN